MSIEIEQSYWERTNKFLLNNKENNRFYLMGKFQPEFNVDVQFCMSFFPEKEDFDKVRPIVFCDSKTAENIGLRSLFELSYDSTKMDSAYSGNIDEMLAEIKKAFTNGAPICAVSFGIDRNTHENIVCIHAIPGMTPSRVLDVAKKESEALLFGSAFNLPDNF